MIQRAHALASLIDLFNESYVPLLKNYVPETVEETDQNPLCTWWPELPANCVIGNELAKEREYLFDHLTRRVGVLLQTLDDPEIDRLVDTQEFWLGASEEAEKLMDGLEESTPSFKALFYACKRLCFPDL